MKQKILSSFILSILIIFCSCNNLISSGSEEIKETEQENLEKDIAYLDISINETSFSARTILPEKGVAEDYSYKLYGTNGSSNTVLLGEWISYNELKTSKVELQTGSWIFELQAIKENVPVLSGINSSLIVIGVNQLTFSLKEMDSGYGNIYINMYIQNNLYEKVEAVLLDEEGDSISGQIKKNLTITTDNVNNKLKSVFETSYVSKGYYIVRFYFYKKTTDSNYATVYNTFIRVEPGLTSLGDEEISFDEQLCEISIPITSISIKTKPNNLVYYAEQQLNLTGLVVCANYEDGSTKEITNYTTSIENGTKLKTTDTNIVIAYGEFTQNFEISVIPNTVNGIMVTVPAMLQDIQGLLTFSSETNIFTAKIGYSSYTWYIDEQKINNSTRYYQIDASTVSSGNHTLMLVVKDSTGNNFSASAEFVIHPDYISFIKIVIDSISDVSGLITCNESILTAITGYKTYMWWIDDILQSTSTNVLEIPSSIEPGNHSISLIVKDSEGNYYSETLMVTITHELLNIYGNSDHNVIYITINNYQDIEDLLVYDSSLLQFTAKKGYESYSWWIDNIKINNNKNTYSPIKSEFSNGTHTVMVIVSDSNGNFYSCTKSFTIFGDYQDPNCNNSAIYIVMPEYSEVDNLITYEKFIFSAKSGFASYSWWIDTTKTNNTSRVFNLNALEFTEGNHTLLLVVTDDNGNTYSNTIEIVINK